MATHIRLHKKTAGTRRSVPAASPKTRKRSEECTCWLVRYTNEHARTVWQKLVVGESFTSILIDALDEKGLQDGQPEVTLTYIYRQHYIFGKKCT